MSNGSTKTAFVCSSLCVFAVFVGRSIGWGLSLIDARLIVPWISLTGSRGRAGVVADFLYLSSYRALCTGSRWQTPATHLFILVCRKGISKAFNLFPCSFSLLIFAFLKVFWLPRIKHGTTIERRNSATTPDEPRDDDIRALQRIIEIMGAL
jgi:hypothetical protein